MKIIIIIIIIILNEVVKQRLSFYLCIQQARGMKSSTKTANVNNNGLSWQSIIYESCLEATAAFNKHKRRSCQEKVDDNA
jgi:hypothetical protein